MNGNKVSVDISVSVDYGIPIQKVGRNCQENVRKSIETMTGLTVEKVDLHVVSVSFEKENQEMQESQKLALALEEEQTEEKPAALPEEPEKAAEEPAAQAEEAEAVVPETDEWTDEAVKEETAEEAEDEEPIDGED